MRLVALVAWFALVACSKRDQVVTVFAASSMAQTLDQLRAPFEREHPGWEIRTELSGSRVACRKVVDQGRRADLLIVADRELLTTLVLPAHARFEVGFASNALVLAHAKGTSAARALANGTPWQTVLAADDVRVGIADPELAPVGYRALMALALNDKSAVEPLRTGAVISGRLGPRNLRDDVAKLSAGLETNSIDVAFIYESEALQHGLAYTRLDPAIDFSDAARADWYASESYDVAGVTIYGSPAVLAATVPTNAEHPELGAALLALLISDEGRGIAGATHLTPFDQPRVSGDPPSALR